MHVRRKRYRPIRSVFSRSVFLVIIILSVIVGGKALSIYADDTDVSTSPSALENTSVPPVLDGDNSLSTGTNNQQQSTATETSQIPSITSDSTPVLPSAPDDTSDTSSKTNEDTTSLSEETPPTYVNLVPDIPKDPDDNTDEDPEIDLIDPLVESQPPAPEPEAPIVVASPEENEQLPESVDTSDSVVALLDQVTFTSEPPLSRIIAEDVLVDLSAKHSCRVEKFRADISGSSLMKMRVKFLPGLPGDYVAEIGSLPTGIDVVFAANKEYSYSLKPSDTLLDLEIINQVGSDDGNFSVPIIYTKIGQPDSSVICQMNILNNGEE